MLRSETDPDVLTLMVDASTNQAEIHASVFVSYNVDDAKEKINYARQLHEELPLAYQKRLVVDSKTELGNQHSAGGERVRVGDPLAAAISGDELEQARAQTLEPALLHQPVGELAGVALRSTERFAQLGQGDGLLSGSATRGRGQPWPRFGRGFVPCLPRV